MVTLLALALLAGLVATVALASCGDDQERTSFVDVALAEWEITIGSAHEVGVRLKEGLADRAPGADLHVVERVVDVGSCGFSAQ